MSQDKRDNPRMPDPERLADVNRQIADLHAQLKPLTAERAELVTAQARMDWPDGPFTLHYWRRFSEDSDEYDTPLEAVRAAKYLEDSGDGSTEKITDRHGNTIYDTSGYPMQRVAAGYPEVPDDL